MRIMITGGAGFIGSHLAEAFLAAGHAVAVLDNLVAGKRENLARTQVPLFQVDVRDRAAVAEAFAAFRPDVVSHHAAQMAVKASGEDPVYDAHVNVMGLLHVAEAALAVGAKKFVFASSGGTVYGECPVLPSPEDAPTVPLAPYGLSKLAGERYLAYYRAARGLSTTVLRYGNVYGPRQDPHGEAGVVAIFAQKLLSGGRPTIHGDGVQRKDYVHVRDVVRANLLALEAGDGGTYNIGSGIATSVNELHAIMARAAGSSLPPLHGPQRPGDVRTSWLDIGRAAAELGWRPELDLAEGMHDTLAYFGERLLGTDLAA